jgi:hypothetical protein
VLWHPGAVQSNPFEAAVAAESALSPVQTLDRRSSLLHTGVVSAHSFRMRQAILLCLRESAHRVLRLCVLCV